MRTLNRALTILVSPVLATTLTLGLAGRVAATTGYEGPHSDNGAQCFFDELNVNHPNLYAFDATTGVDVQTVAWTSEIWRLDEATGAFVFDTAYPTWNISQATDGTDAEVMVIGGQQTFTINVPGTYKAAIRYSWEATATTPAGEAYEWVGAHYLTDMGWILGLGITPTGDSCSF